MPANHRSSKTRRFARPDLVLAAGILALCAGVVTGFSWSRSATATATLTYTQSGRLSYSARTSASSVYGRSGLTSGDPIYAAAVRRVAVSYTYDFNADEPTALSGSEQLVATMTNGEGLSRTIPLQSKSLFTGSHFDAAGTLNLEALQTTANAFDSVSGSVGAGTFDVSISPRVALHGRLGSAQVRATFNQPVSFTYTAASGASPANLIPGVAANQGAGTGQTTSDVAASTLLASTSGSVDVPGGRAATLAFGIGVTRARMVSLAVLAVALLFTLVFGFRLVGSAISDDERVRIATRYGTSLVAVDELPSSPGLVVIELSSFDGLREVATRLECPVLHHVVRDRGRRESDVYAVVDGGALYRYSTGRAGRADTKPPDADDSTAPRTSASGAYERVGRASGILADDEMAIGGKADASRPTLTASRNGDRSGA